MKKTILREAVILAKDFQSLYKWYRDTLELKVIQLHEGDLNYCILGNDEGLKIGIACAKQMQLENDNRAINGVVIQFECEDVVKFCEKVEAAGGSLPQKPCHNKQDDFWFACFADPEGNPSWLVDANCP